MIRRPPRSTRVRSSAASDVYKRQLYTMSIYPTVIGGFPNYFLEMDLSEAGDFLRGLRDVQSLADWNRLRDRYGILRNDARFWSTYDWFTQWNCLLYTSPSPRDRTRSR